MKTLFASIGLCLGCCALAETEKKPTPAVPTFVDGETQIVEGFKDPEKWIRHDLWVETEFDSDADGKLDRMHVGVTRPEQTESEGLKLPVIMVSSPYFGGKASKSRDYFWNVRHELGDVPEPRKHFPLIVRTGERPVISNSLIKEWVPHGYILVHTASPGSELSEGCPSMGLDNESLAPKAVVDWLNGRAPGFTSLEGNERVEAYWTTGKVGMTGVSHPGTFALAAASTGVDGLEVVIPVAANTSPYHYYRSNGLVRHPLGYLGEDIDYMYDIIHSGNDVRREWCDATMRDDEMAKGMDRVTGDYNEFWRKRDYLHDLAPVKAAVLMGHGLNDWNVMPEHGNRIYQALKGRSQNTQLFLHQGGHGGYPPKKMMNRWFAQYLHGQKNEVEKGPRAWIVREDADRSEPTAYDDFPNPASAPVTFHLKKGAPNHGELLLGKPSKQGRETVVDNFSFSGAALAQAEWTEHRLMYVTPELTKPLHISGMPNITVRMASSKPAVNLSVWVVSLPWEEKKKDGKITDNIITRGWSDPQNRHSITESEPLVPGEFVDVTFDLQPDDQIIPAGQKIGVMIFSSDKDYTLWPDPGTRLTVDLDPTSVTFPIVGGEKAVSEAFIED